MELLGVVRRLPHLRQAAIQQTKWICPSCKLTNSYSRRFASNLAKPYYVTTPIFYVNAAPHIGHMYTMILADVLKRWQTLQGNQALLCTGTDEHGMKVRRAAALEDLPPKQFCDTTTAIFKDLAQKSGIDYDFFIRTTDADHVEAVQHFWFLLREKGLIYETTHKGWYSVTDEAFYPEKMTERRIHPMTGKTFMASTETGNEVEYVEEKNYCFRMTAMKDRLLEFYKMNPHFVLPDTRMNEVSRWVADNLQDLSISRPVSRLDWGIPVPGDPNQTIYVWVDALINYITKAGFPNWPPGLEHEGGWPADIHVIGKDILRFHAVYWPALLLALDMPPPKQILSHAHWTLGNKKMSKSAGNVVNPFFAIDRFGMDAVRFFMIYHGGVERDSPYDNGFVVDRYNNSLANGIGNLLNRVTLPKLWKIKDTIERARDEELPRVNDIAVVHRHVEVLKGLTDKICTHMDRLDSRLALQNIDMIVRETNSLLTKAAPWNSIRSEEHDVQAAAKLVVYYAAESLRIAGILLQAFIPTSATKILDILGVKQEHRTLSHTQVGKDFEYGVPMGEHGRREDRHLFPRLAVED